MPYVTLKFKLPQEAEEFKDANNASKMSCVLWDIDQYCRGVLKHGEPSKELQETLEHIRSLIDHGLIHE